MCLGKQPVGSILADGVLFFFSVAATLLIVLKLVTYFPSVYAVDLEGCGFRLQQQQDAVWNATNQTEPPPQLRLTYEQCSAECGAGLGDVNWRALSGTFGSWLLPWIALMFQMPFGGQRKLQCFTFGLAFIEQCFLPQSHWMTFSPS